MIDKKFVELYPFLDTSLELEERQMMFHDFLLDQKGKTEYEVCLGFIEKVKNDIDSEDIIECIGSSLKLILHSQAEIFYELPNISSKLE